MYDNGESNVKIHPLVILGVGLALMAFGHTPAPKRLEGLDKQRARARALFNVMPDCTLSVRGMPPGGVSAVQLITKFAPMDQEYFYPMLGRAYLDGISDSDDIADYILKDLFPECDPPFTPDITGAMYLHVINLKLQGLGFAPSTSGGGIEAFRDYWNRFIAWLERHDPAVIAARPTVYRRFELEDDRLLGDDGHAALDKAYTRWANIEDGEGITIEIDGKAYEVQTFWDMVETAERVTG